MRDRLKSNYWIFSTHFECPVCGSCRTYRERRYGKKPKSWLKRQKTYLYFDYCDQ